MAARNSNNLNFNVCCAGREPERWAEAACERGTSAVPGRRPVPAGRPAERAGLARRPARLPACRRPGGGAQEQGERENPRSLYCRAKQQ